MYKGKLRPLHILNLNSNEVVSVHKEATHGPNFVHPGATCF
uniref:Uncharacterized protein n=1 Tax=Arundo donax TaxID=35708 RepID=A0A0A9FSA7_ARUDO